jgi:hypothetical protein
MRTLEVNTKPNTITEIQIDKIHSRIDTSMDKLPLRLLNKTTSES